MASHSTDRAPTLDAMNLRGSESQVGYALENRPMTADEFRAWDANQTIKHEFVRGEVFSR